MLKYALLGILNYRPMVGYELKQAMDTSTAHFWYARLSQIYRTLGELEDGGLVTSEMHEQEKRPDRRVYTITQAGRTALRAWLEEPITIIEPEKVTLLLKVFFSAQLDTTTVLTQLRLQRTLHQQQLERFRTEIPARLAESAKNPTLTRDVLFWDLTRRCGELTEEAAIRWLDEAITILQEHHDQEQFEKRG